MQFKSFVNDMGENAIVAIGETWLMPDDDSSLWNVAASTHELFRCDRSQNKAKKEEWWCITLCAFINSTKRT